MLFKFSKKKIVLDCFTKEEHVINYAPIDYAIKHMPDWWKNLPPTVLNDDGFSPRATTKKCIGISDYYKYSIVLPLWSDLSIRIAENKSYEWHFSDGETNAIVHDMANQATGFLSSYGHMKIVSPWAFKTKEDIKWVWTHPTYSFKDSSDITSLPAIIDYKYQTGTNINIMLNLNSPKTILIPHGQPLAHMVPMSDRKVEIVRHLVSEKEFRSIQSINRNITFIDKYQSIKQKTEKFSRCPFHIGN
jgi:hypothetical protein